ncbi:MAG: hypothetical protein ACYC0C_08775 [Devosia sp.]
MKINKAWHEAHKMSKDTTLEQRLDWHLNHAANCTCREMPESIKRELEARGLTVPTPRSLR